MLNHKKKTNNSKIKNNFWLWCHEANSHKVHNLPTSRITPVEAAKYMGIENLIMVDFAGYPKPPFQQYFLPMKSMNQVVWSLTGAGGRLVDIKEIMKLDIDGLILDDFFGLYSEGKNFYATGGKIPIKELEKVKAITKKDLWLTLYAGQLPDKIRDYVNICDKLNLWVWYPEALDRLEEIISNYEKRFPNKTKLLGCYMYDYSENKPLPIKKMQMQCEIALKSLKEGKIDGIIFLASCICDLNLEAVEWTKCWINKVGEKNGLAI